MSFSRCNGGARSWAGSRRISSIIPFLIAMVATFQQLAHAQLPHLRLKFELPYGGGR